MNKSLFFLLNLSLIFCNPSLIIAESPLALLSEDQASQHMLLNFYNEEIENLEDQRDKYEAKAARLQDQGDRLQFQPGYLIEARRNWQMADTAQQIADKIDEQIRQMKKEREQLIKEMQGEN